MHITEVVVRLWLGRQVSPEGGHSCLSLIKKSPQWRQPGLLCQESNRCGLCLLWWRALLPLFLCGGFWCLIILFYLTCQAVSFDCLFNNSPRMFSCRKF